MLSRFNDDAIRSECEARESRELFDRQARVGFAPSEPMADPSGYITSRDDQDLWALGLTLLRVAESLGYIDPSKFERLMRARAEIEEVRVQAVAERELARAMERTA